MPHLNAHEGAFALMMLAYNNSPVKLAEKLMPGRHPDYIEEWVHRFAKSLPFAVGCMDDDTFRRFCDLAFEEYGNAVAGRFE